MTVTDRRPKDRPNDRTSPRLGLGHVVLPEDLDRRPEHLYARQRVKVGRPVQVAVVGLIVLLLLQLTWTRLTSERSIENRAGNAVQRAGFVAVTVESTGRDVTLRGRTATLAEAYQAVKLTQAQEGVREVKSEIVVDPSVITAATAKARAAAIAAGVDPGPEPVTSLPPTPTVQAELNDGKVRLAGVVGDKPTALRLIAAAAKVFGESNVTNDLLVDSSAGTTGAAGLVAGLSSLNTSATGTYKLQLGTVTYSGTVDSVAVHDAVLARSRAAIKDIGKVFDSLVVVTSGPEEPLVESLTSVTPPTFDKQTAALSTAGQQSIQDIAAALQADESFKVRIDGNVDTTSSAAADKSLSRDRAETVRNALVDAGVDPGRLSTRGLGDTKPLVAGTSDVNRAINTRIEIVVLTT